jgi:hypothetical protein
MGLWQRLERWRRTSPAAVNEDGETQRLRWMEMILRMLADVCREMRISRGAGRGMD